MLERRNILWEKVDALSKRYVKMVMCLRERRAPMYMLSQIARCPSSIGANVAESKNAQSRADFVSKLNVALKEADETIYWLGELHQADVFKPREYDSIRNDTKEIIYLLIAIIKKTRQNGL